MRMLVLGAGLQGAACAYDLLQQPGVTAVTLADSDFAKSPPVLDHCRKDPRLTLLTLDARDHAAVRKAMDGHAAVMCALPYYFNLDMTRLAIEPALAGRGLGAQQRIRHHRLAGELLEIQGFQAVFIDAGHRREGRPGVDVPLPEEPGTETTHGMAHQVDALGVDPVFLLHDLQHLHHVPFTQLPLPQLLFVRAGLRNRQP